jgi:hypothetical protein
MGGRERRGSRLRRHAASDGFSRVVAALGEPFTTKAEGGESQAQPGPGWPSSGEGIGGRVQ